MDESELYAILRQVVDPEVGVDVVELGLVEAVRLRPDHIHVAMIMTTPACPQAGQIVDEARDLIVRAAGPGIEVEVELLDTPFWTPERMSDTARAALGWGG